MTRTAYIFLLLGIFFAGLAVAAGAFGAHSLKAILTPKMLDVFETAVRYQMYHALALVIVGWVASSFPGLWFRLTGWSFVAGILLFSGSLYALTLTGTRGYDAITPLGGLAFLLGWCFFGWGIWTQHRSNKN
jgi:uncharacterized membrane protein YgdD (TMEM256/DUF423 family)